MTEKEKPFTESQGRKMTHAERVRAFSGGKTEGRKMTEEERKVFYTSLQKLTDEAKRTGDWSALLGQDTDIPPLIK